MKHLKMYCLAVVLCMAGTVYAQEQQLRAADLREEGVFREGAAAIAPELDRAAFADVLSTGVTPLYDEAVVGDGAVTDPAGNVATAHMAFVPFVHPVSGKRGYYMRISVSASDGTALFDHEYAVHDLDCHCAESDAGIHNGSPPKWDIETQSFASDVSKLAQWIRARNWGSVRNWIGAQLARGMVKGMIANIVKAAFEKAGYWCPNLPWYVPGKFYIYLASCVQRAY